MAFHTRLFNHSLLRVSKLKLSQTTQAIERNNEKTTSTTVCSAHTLRSSWPDFVFPETAHQEDTLMPTQPNDLTSRKLKNRKSLTAQFPHDGLSLVVKPISYTTDDIITYPMAAESRLGQGVFYENHNVTILTESGKGVEEHAPPATDIIREKNIQLQEVETGLSLLHKAHFRRHSICDSNPTFYHEHFTDCSVMQCWGDSGLRSDTAFCLSKSGLDGVPYKYNVWSESEIPESRSGGSKNSAGAGRQGPSLDQLKALEAYFIETLPKFFKTRLEYRMYHPEIVFENNFWGKNEVSSGITQYALQIAKLRAMTHFKYAHVHMDVISSSCMPEEGLIRIQWKIVGLSQFKAMRFWRYTAWGYSKSFREDAEWTEGISIYHVDKDGLVIKHILDRMSPDEEQVKKAPTVMAKLALLLGLSAPKPSLSDFSSLL